MSRSDVENQRHESILIRSSGILNHRKEFISCSKSPLWRTPCFLPRISFKLRPIWVTIKTLQYCVNNWHSTRSITATHSPQQQRQEVFTLSTECTIINSMKQLPCLLFSLRRLPSFHSAADHRHYWSSSSPKSVCPVAAIFKPIFIIKFHIQGVDTYLYYYGTTFAPLTFIPKPTSRVNLLPIRVLHS